jgi:hypothetical protein
MKEYIKKLLRENFNGNLPTELKGMRYEKNIIGRFRECTSGYVNVSDLKLFDNALDVARKKLNTDSEFKISNSPIIVGVDINNGNKTLLDGYHRYVYNSELSDGIKYKLKAYFIPMSDGDIIDFSEINIKK